MAAISADSADSATASFEAEEVVLVRRRPGQSDGSYDVFSLQESTEDGQAPFKLVRAQVADIPQDVPDHLLVEQVPEHLLNGPSRKVHVLVSTDSGTGRAVAFYEAVLQPLLDVLGLTASEGDSTDGSNRYNLVTTTDGQSIRRFGRTLDEDNDSDVSAVHTAVILSGDGGIVELLNAKAPADNGSSEGDKTVSPPPPLIAILPLGTGNALFNSLHKLVEPASASSLVQGLRTLLTGVAAPLPSFRADFSPGSRLITYQEGQGSKKGDGDAVEVEVEEHTDAVSHLHGAIVASYGFHSQLVWESDTPEYRRHGAQRFGMVAKELLEKSHAYDATVEITDVSGDDDSTSTSTSTSASGKPEQQQRKKERRKIDRDRHAYVLATLVSNLEKTFTISPASRPLDGRLRLVHFGDVGGERTMDVMMRAYDGGKHVGMKWEEVGKDEVGTTTREERVGYEEVGEVKITTHEEDARWRKVCIDGTIVEVPQGGSMTVTVEEKGKAHLNILVDRSVVA